MKALVLAPFSPQALKRLEGRLKVIYQSWLETRRLLSPEEMVDWVEKEDIGVLVVEADFVLEEVLEGAKSLKLVGVCRGTTSNIDLEVATQQRIPVIYTPGRNAAAVAELTIGLMLCLARHIIPAHNMVKFGKWQDPVGPYMELRGEELGGKTMGLVGLGAIGLEVAKKLAGFDMKLLVYDPYVPGERGRKIKAQLVSLEELLQASDWVSIHCPLTAETTNLLNGRRLSLMKPTAYLINTAAAEVVEGAALVSALREKRIAGAALDVFETHPLVPHSPYLDLDNVILTPHIGGATKETVERHSLMMVEDIERFLEGKRPLRLLNPEVWSHG